MLPLRKAMSFILMLTLISQIVSPAFANEPAPSKKEMRKEARFFKKFDKKFDRFAEDVEDMMYDYSDAELNLMYEDMIVWLEQHGHYEMAKVMMAQHAKGRGTTRQILAQMTTERSRQEAKAALKLSIQKAGGFDNFMKLVKAQRKANVDVKCRVKKIGSMVLIAPVTYIGMVTGMAAVGALVSGTVTLGVAASVGTTVLTEGFAFPWFIDNMTVGCYNETDHPDFTNLKN
jgi:hypothetical protein